jgi:hypothetical protein
VGVLGGEKSPAHIDGEILAVSAAPAVLSSSSAARPSQALSYRVSVTMRVKLYRGSELLTQTDVSGAEDYLQGQRPDILSVESNRVAALKRHACCDAAGSLPANVSRACLTTDFTCVRTDWLRARRTEFCRLRFSADFVLATSALRQLLYREG